MRPTASGRGPPGSLPSRRGQECTYIYIYIYIYVYIYIYIYVYIILCYAIFYYVMQVCIILYHIIWYRIILHDLFTGVPRMPPSLAADAASLVRGNRGNRPRGRSHTILDYRLDYTRLYYNILYSSMT